jgi:hypothetical protein
MALSDNPFIGLPLADILGLQTQFKQAIQDVLAAGQSYSFPGRTFTRASLPYLYEGLGYCNTAISVASGGGAGKQFVQATVDTQSTF